MSLKRPITFVMIKPDGVERGLVGAIIQRFEQKELQLHAMRVVIPSNALVEHHYAEHAEKPYFQDLVDSIANKKVVCMTWSAEADTVQQVRTLVGATFPLQRRPGTIRHDFASTLLRNVIHASDSDDAVEREMKLWF